MVWLLTKVPLYQRFDGILDDSVEWQSNWNVSQIDGMSKQHITDWGFRVKGPILDLVVWMLFWGDTGNYTMLFIDFVNDSRCTTCIKEIRMFAYTSMWQIMCVREKGKLISWFRSFQSRTYIIFANGILFIVLFIIGTVITSIEFCLTF